MKAIFCLLVFMLSFQSYANSSYKKKWGYKSISCSLSHNAILDIEKKGRKIKASHKREKSKLNTVFTDLDTDKPRMIYPDNTELIKLKEEDGTYWLISGALFGITLFIVNTKNKWMVQQRANSILDKAYFYSWGGKCE